MTWNSKIKGQNNYANDQCITSYVPPVLTIKVNLGRVKRLHYQHRPLSQRWMRETYPQKNNATCFCTPTDPNEIISSVSSVNYSNSWGVDIIDRCIVQLIIIHILNQLTYIFSQSAKCLFHRNLNRKVVPLYTNENPQLFKNHWPIYNIPALIKQYYNA